MSCISLSERGPAKTSSRGWPLACMVVGTLGALVVSGEPVHAKDVTAQVRKETDLDERVADACRRHCQGNRSEGKLTRVLVTRRNQYLFDVRADASLRNRHHQKTGIGGGFQAYSYTIGVEAYGTLDERTCRLTIDRIKLTNDKLGLGRLANAQEGKTHRIDNCGRFLVGL